MYKLIIIAVLCVFTSLSSFAQNKVAKFCQITIKPKNNFTLKRAAYISFGDQPNLFNLKESTEIRNLQKVADLTTAPDVLNYMSNLGWSVFSIHSVSGTTLLENLYFKKEFDKSELADQ